MRRLVSGRLALLVVVAALSSACLDGGGEATPTRTAPEEKVGGSDDLHRPLDLPSVAPGTVGNAKLTFVTLILRAARYWPMDEDGA